MVQHCMMGPNVLKLTEKLCTKLDLQPGMRVLDLGCGKGLSSLFLAKEYGVQVYATDLWISPTENYQRFLQQGVAQTIVPIYGEATKLPYAENFFDVAVSVDSYHYFGANGWYLDKHLSPLVKPGGKIAIAVPGIQRELGKIPQEMQPYWNQEVMETFHSCTWWSGIFGNSQKTSLLSIEEIEEKEEIWLACEENPYAVGDRDMIKADAGKYMNLISVWLERNKD